MKRILLLLLAVLMLSGCGSRKLPAQVVATTLPVYEFTAALCENTSITVERLITEEVSCLHDFSLKVSQMQSLEAAQLVIFNGAGLDDFMTSGLPESKLLDASSGIDLHCIHQEHDHDNGHSHDEDPHIWLSVQNARQMANSICNQLISRYPDAQQQISKNMQSLEERFDNLANLIDKELSGITGKQIITFHDGFGYLAEELGITIIHTIEEESGSEASAAELKYIIQLIEENEIPAIFTEAYGSASAAGIVSAETGVLCYTLDMAMAGDSWFSAMEHNIKTLKEALE